MPSDPENKNVHKIKKSTKIKKTSITRKEKYDQALILLKNGIEISLMTNLPQLYYFCSFCYKRLGDNNTSKVYFEIAEKLFNTKHNSSPTETKMLPKTIKFWIQRQRTELYGNNNINISNDI